MTKVSTEPIYLRTTERRMFAACRQQWWWSFIDELEADDTSGALRFGDLVHQALGSGVPELKIQPWYKTGEKRGPHPAKTFEILYDRQIEEGMDDFSVFGDEDERTDARTLGITMLEEYVAVYGKDDHIRVIAPEMAAQVPVLDVRGKPMRVLGRDGLLHPLVYALTFDLVFEDMNNGRIGLLETKTARAIGVRHLPMDEQAGSYWTFAPDYPPIAKALAKVGKDDIDFILYNFLRKAMPDLRPVNEYGHRLNKPTKDALLAKATELGLTLPKSTKVDDLMTAIEVAGFDPVQLGEPSKNQPPAYFLRHPVYRDPANREALLQRVRMQAWEMGKVRAGELPVYKSPAMSWPNQTCAGCEFRDMCELHESGSDWEELRDLTMHKWSPYEGQLLDSKEER